jgi:D-alanine-D-alanine ligase
LSKLRLGLIFGGRSQEHEISIMSARSVYQAADKDKYDLIPFAISKKGYWLDPVRSLAILQDENVKEVPEDITSSISQSIKSFLDTELDLVFPVLHGPFGEDGRLQGLLEMLDIPYVGTGVLSSAVGMDKGVMKHLFAIHGLPQGRYLVLYENEIKTNLDEIIKKIDKEIKWPCFVKPANLGSSIGISKVNKAEDIEGALAEALKYDYKIVIEEYIKGREIECSVRGNIDILASLPGEIRITHDFYDYNAKYQDESTELIIPAKLDKEITDRVRELAIKAFKAIDGRGFARVDFFLTENNDLILNEVNTIPGFTRYSMYPKMWEATGLKYSDLINDLIKLALEWHRK